MPADCDILEPERCRRTGSGDAEGRAFVLLALTALLLSAGGCGAPNAANIELRKQKQALENRITQLEQQRRADQAAIRGIESRVGTVPTLPQARLDELFTVHSIELGRLTGGADLDPARPGEEGLKVYVTPMDEDGQRLKAAGSFVIEAFDLALPDHHRVGRWEFDVKSARQHWLGVALVYAYALPCPWQQPPQHAELTVKVTFTDALTGRLFEAQQPVKVNLPATAATRPSSK